MIEDAYTKHRREDRRKRRERDAEATKANRITVAEFARLHKLNAWSLRRRLRMAGYDRGGRMRLPIKDLENFCGVKRR